MKLTEKRRGERVMIKHLLSSALQQRSGFALHTAFVDGLRLKALSHRLGQ